MENLDEILERLIRGEVEFVLVGGLAAVVHGCSLVTHDVDVAIALQAGNLQKLWHALDGTHAFFRHTRPRRYFSLEDTQRLDWKNIYLDTDLGVVDCLGEVKAVGDYQRCLERSVEFEYGDLSLRTLDREALIEAKSAIGRPQDILAVSQLKVLGGAQPEQPWPNCE